MSKIFSAGEMKEINHGLFQLRMVDGRMAIGTWVGGHWVIGEYLDNKRLI